MTALAIITARGGSKRIPRKNIRSFCGEPIIAYSIRAALESGCFDQVMVSTEDAEIAEVGRAHGAEIPFLRSTNTSGDHATTAAVLIEVLEGYARKRDPVEFACCIYPTAPFVKGDLLKRGLQMLTANPKLSGVFSVAQFSHPIQRALRITDGRVSALEPKHLLARTQDLEPIYHDAGQFYWINVSHFMARPDLISERSGAIIVPNFEAQDIDTEDDWNVAEAKYLIRKQSALSLRCHR